MTVHEKTAVTVLAIVAYVLYFLCFLATLYTFLTTIEVRKRTFLEMLRWNVVIDITNFKIYRNIPLILGALFAVCFFIAGFLSTLNWEEYGTS